MSHITRPRADSWRRREMRARNIHLGSLHLGSQLLSFDPREYAHKCTHTCTQQWFDSRLGAAAIDLSAPTLVGLVVNITKPRLFGLYKSHHWSGANKKVLTLAAPRQQERPRATYSNRPRVAHVPTPPRALKNINLGSQHCLINIISDQS